MKTRLKTHSFLGLCLFLASLSPLTTQAETAKPPHPALPSVEVPGALGVNIHFTDERPGELDMLAAGGFKVIRMDFAWGATEKGKGQYDFSAYDRLLKSLEAHKLQPLFILDYSNELYDEGLSPYSEAGRTAFAHWAGAAAKHFKGHKVLWEMYNEPNIGFWKPKPKVDDYVKLALATGKAIQRDAPGECYIGPGSSGIDLNFIEACFKGGLLELWEAVSVHPYRGNNPESASDDYRKLRLMIERYKPRGKTIPILSGEWGYTSTNVNDEVQGKYLPRQWMTNLMNRIPVSIWYDWHNDGTDPKEGEHNFGTTKNEYFAGRTPVYDAKPSYIAARTLTQNLNGFRYNKRLALDSPNDYLLLFSKGTEVKLAAWTTGRPHDITIPTSEGTFKAVNYLGEAQPDITSTATGMNVRLSDAPLYLVPVKPNATLLTAAKWEAVPLEEFYVAPTRIIRNGQNFTVRRDTPPFEITQKSVVWKQISQGVVTNPLTAVVEPSLQNTLQVRLENPSGAKTVGQVTLNGTNAQAVNFIDTEKTLSFPLPAQGPDGSWEAKVRFAGNTQGDIVELTYRFVALKSFEGLTADNLATSLVARPDGDAAIESEQKLSIENAPEAAPSGGPTLKLTYRFAPGWKFANVQPLTPNWAKIDGQPKRLGMWVYGDNSGHLLRMRFSDSTGQTFQPGGTALNWKGWRYYSFPLDTAGGHWSGANDGQLHGAIKVESLFLLDSAERKGGQGAIYISSPSWIY